MDWFKKHCDTVVILGGIVSCMLWMNGKFNEIEKDMAVIKAVLIIQKILPSELASNHEDIKQ